MTAAKRLALVSVEDDLAGELVSDVKQEYLGGVAFATSGWRNVHNAMATNIAVAIGSRLRGRPCRPFNSDTKIRVRLPTQWRFYYPDCSVVCRRNPPEDSFQDDPVINFEVLSRSTQRVDEGEKKDAYRTIPSLSVYALVKQDSPQIVLYRRAETGFVPEVFRSAGRRHSATGGRNRVAPGGGVCRRGFSARAGG
jgi:Uma2 family endonuclease